MLNSHLEEFKDRLPQALLLLPRQLTDRRNFPGQPLIQFRKQYSQSSIDQCVLIQLWLLPGIAINEAAQDLNPQAIGDGALLGIAPAPGNNPASLLYFPAQLFSQSRLTDTRFSHQHHALRSAQCIKRNGCIVLLVDKLLAVEFGLATML